MGYTTLQNTPITINLDDLSKTTGWTLDKDTATHEACNAGYLTLDAVLEENIPYNFSLKILSISGGKVRVDFGNVSSADYITSGLKVFSLTSTSGGIVKIYSDADCVINIFTNKQNVPVTTLKQQQTKVYKELTNKWTSFLTYNPDSGTSLFSNTYLYKNGNMYVQVNENTNRNNFFGNQYKSIIKFPSSIPKSEPKTFKSIAYEANKLLVTTENGITTSLGQVSELIDLDFLKDVLTDGVDEVKIYDVEGVYSANLMRDKNTDIINGDELKGTYITIELTTVDDGALLLRNIQVNSVPSKIGVR